jgi:two-component system, sensor histidine kinase YesM
MQTFYKKIINFLLFYKRISIRQKITLSVIVIVLFPMLLTGFYFYWNTSTLLTQNAYYSLDQLIGQINENLQTSFKVLDTTSFYFASNKTIRLWASEDNDYIKNDFYDLFLKKSEIEAELKYSMLFNNAWDSKLITTAYLFINESNFCSVSRSTSNINTVNRNNAEIFKKLSIDSQRERKILPPSLKNQTIYYTINIANLNNPGQCLRLIIGTDEVIFSQKYDKILEFPKSKAFIMDNAGIIYSHPDKSMLGQKVEQEILDMYNSNKAREVVKLKNQQFLMAFKKIDNTNLIFVSGIPKEQVLTGLNDSMKNYLIITLLIFAACLIFSILLSLRFTVFIKHLLYSINKVKTGNYDIKMPIYQDHDLNLLSSTFNNMTGEIKYLINQVYESQLLLKETEFKFLQSQMNPHFLLNILVTIGWKAKMSNNETIYNMVTSLSKLLQASIYTNTNAKVSIREELEYVKFYLYLQGIRFHDRLEYKINIMNDSVMECLIPKLCIEPIVENSVVHGIEKKVGKSMIEINIKQRDTSIYCEIIDNGIGFENNSINLTDWETTVKPQKGHNNIGLSNTNKRIKLMYGEQYGISIDSKIHESTKVTVHIPVDKGEISNV